MMPKLWTWTAERIATKRGTQNWKRKVSKPKEPLSLLTRRKAVTKLCHAVTNGHVTLSHFVTQGLAWQSDNILLHRHLNWPPFRLTEAASMKLLSCWQHFCLWQLANYSWHEGWHKNKWHPCSLLHASCCLLIKKCWNEKSLIAGFLNFHRLSTSTRLIKTTPPHSYKSSVFPC